MATTTEAPAGVGAALSTRHSWVGNRQVEGHGGTRAALQPATGRPFAQVSLLDLAQAREAIATARSAFPAWSRLTFAERGRHLLRLREAVLEDAEEVARLIAEEQGKPEAEAHAVEIFPALEALKHLALHAEDVLRDDPVECEVLLLAHKECRLVYAPLGVVLVITPWNYPFSIALTGVAAALAAGNTVVLKPAPSTSLVGLRIGEMARKVGLPAGVLNVVTVDDGVAAALVEDPRVGKIVFTGSVATGKKVMAAAATNLTPVLLELGGKDPAVVCRDADLDRAAQGIVWGAFLNAGQTCASVERVYVERPVADAFVAKVVAETRKLRQGDPREAEVDVGPLTMERQRKIVEEHVEDAQGAGRPRPHRGREARGRGLLLPAHRAHGRRPHDEGHAGGDVRPRAPDHGGRLRGRGDPARQRQRLRPHRQRLDPRPADRPAPPVRAPGGCRDDQRLHRAATASPPLPGAASRRAASDARTASPGCARWCRSSTSRDDRSRRPALWWFPYGADFTALMTAANRALHASSPFARLKGQLALTGFGRYWRRVSPWSVLKNVDKLF